MTEAGVLNNAISKCTDEEVAVLKEKLALLKEAIFAEDQNVDRVFERDNEFHAAITEMGKNVMISKINAMVMLLTNNTRYESVKYMIESKRNQELYEAHEKVYQMVLNREGSELYANIQRTYFIRE